MTTALILSVLLVLLYRRVLHLWQNQRPGAALLTALALAAVGVLTLSEVAMFVARTVHAVTRTG